PSVTYHQHPDNSRTHASSPSHTPKCRSSTALPGSQDLLSIYHSSSSPTSGYGSRVNTSSNSSP
ncbi:hypothetical protein P7K49_023613, partial [Saguinus oedipus]